MRKRRLVVGSIALAMGAARLRTRTYFTNKVLLGIKASPWRQVFETRCDMGFLELLGITVEAFDYLLTFFKREWQLAAMFANKSDEDGPTSFHV